MGDRRIAIVLLLTLFNLSAGACSLNVEAGVNFGKYDPLSSKATKSVGKIHVICPEGGATAFSLTLEPGAAGTFSQRTLVNGKSKLKYNLYLNPSYTSVWGNGSAGTLLISASGADCIDGCQFPVYAQIPARQASVSAGNYTDTIIANINF